ncbi:MAG: Beta-glucanase/Beta-glucan synthetase, partial [Acidimicrobiales bacterium]|nr:Beta-glucanase/Beta-glucan synthetase [Acidimicrobiales bacterium]
STHGARALAALAAGAALLLACQPLPAPKPRPKPPVVWRVIGGDEFDGNGLDTGLWKPYFSNYGDGGGSVMQCNTPSNVVVSGGTAKIIARRQAVLCPGGGARSFTTGFLGSRDVNRYFPRFGRFDIRARIPHGQGLWPAFWLRHVNGAGVAEVDMMEYLHTDHPGWTSGTLHLDGRVNLSKKYVYVEPPTATPGWHVWGVRIDPSWGTVIDSTGPDVLFRFTLDGITYHSYVDTQHHWASADPQRTWDVAVNMAVGGDWSGNPDDALGFLSRRYRCSEGGTPPASCVATGIRRAVFPATYEIDWVRVYSRF